MKSKKKSRKPWGGDLVLGPKPASAWFNDTAKVALAAVAVNYVCGPVVVIVFLAGWWWGIRNLDEDTCP